MGKQTPAAGLAIYDTCFEILVPRGLKRGCASRANKGDCVDRVLVHIFPSRNLIMLLFLHLGSPSLFERLHVDSIGSAERLSAEQVVLWCWRILPVVCISDSSSALFISRVLKERYTIYLQ